MKPPVKKGVTMKRLIYLGIVLIPVFMGGTASPQSVGSYLVKVEIADLQDVQELIDARISVLEVLDRSAIAKSLPGDLQYMSAQGFGFSVLDQNPEVNEYYLVHVNPQCDSTLLHQYGEVLAYDGRTAILKNTTGKALELPRFKFELKRLRDRSIHWEPRAAPQPLPLSNPLIEQLVSQVSQDDITTYIGDLSGENEVMIGGQPYTIETRYSYTEGCEKAADYVYERFTEMGLAAEYHDYSGSYAYQVIAELPGLVTPEAIVIVCGHLDATSQNPYVDAPGADDNASGTAAVLEVASIFSQYNFESTIRFCAWTGEEQGLVGSGYYAAQAAAAGDSIIAVLNFDMIGYVDNPPEDLDVISNFASEWLADFFIAAADTYTTLPTDKQVSGMGYSDHASFWDEGYSAILGIEDSGVPNPYYHTTGDLLSTLTLPFATNVIRAATAAAASLAHPMPLNEPFVILESHTLTDGAGGNGDGLASPGETIDVTVTLGNIGQQPADSVDAVLSTDDSYVTIIDSTEYFGEILGDSTSIQVDAYQFSVSSACTSGHVIPFSLDITSTSNQWSQQFEVHVYAPKMRRYYVAVVDTAGNGDGVLDPGESVELTVAVINRGGLEATDVAADITTFDPWVLDLGLLGPYGNIPADSSGAQNCNLTLDQGCPELHTIAFELLITAEPGYSWTDSLELTVSGAVFADNMEGSTGSWSHYTATPGYGDQWHLSEQRSYSSSHSWKCGNTGPGDYSNLLDAALITPPLFLPPFSEMTFWHWMDAETYSATVAWDGGVVEITTDDGESWTQITPEGDYPYTIRPNDDSPFPGGTPCYSGTHSWTQAEFDLSSYSGPVQLRFRFGTDAAVTEEGWYVDDLEIDRMPLPHIHVDPGEVHDTLPQGEYQEQFVTITNSGELELDFSISLLEEADTMWLDVFPVTGSVPADSAVDVSVTLDASNVWTGTYSGEIHIHNNDPFDSLKVVIASLQVGATLTRADANSDLEVTMGDVISTLKFLYVPGTDSLTCMDAGDSDDDGDVEMSDATYTLKYLYVPGAPAPPAPGPESCGVDPTDDGLDCASHPCFEAPPAAALRRSSVR